MTILKRLSAIPRTGWVLILLGVFVITLFSGYFVREDTLLLEKRIASRQKDVAIVLQLRDSYETKKRAAERYATKKIVQQGMSLALIEEITAKSFVGGKLASLQPTTTREQKEGPQMAVEVKATGVPLGEVIGFVRAVEDSGLRVSKIRLSLPAANSSDLELQATLQERRLHG